MHGQDTETCISVRSVRVNDVTWVVRCQSVATFTRTMTEVIVYHSVNYVKKIPFSERLMYVCHTSQIGSGNDIDNQLKGEN